ncbi:BREX-1 system adenine-specific DNA-methyltransferase PglX [Geofilum rubicundum]|uniref:site-specific DNA-methyltransferase (adenine-specific) n=1 Tax=Geofilum rubicundum JCM 15548 TaxID=1236989 RepID=A0A0E9LUH9_9BACT|nr:BREX-1 system adenine-specific DNA-methyltransferase PglX [Geofilum rubicundum]GAO28938.1 putative type II restriction enzyme methylase subunit [Geofilum rubicundum JCM 15548]
METNKIKSFAKEARLLLLDGVLQRLKYWGFNLDGSNNENLQTTQGGYAFRGKIFTDTTVPKKWNKLKDRIKSEQDVKDIIEEAAYTWFNRLMAIKILEANGYLKPTLKFESDIRIPTIVQQAKRGIHALTKQTYIELLNEYIADDKEEQALGLLITRLCNNHNLMHNVFGKIDDYTELLLPQNFMQADGLLDLINGNAIAEEDYKEVELIGWLYQFYISDKKDEVFAGFKKNQKARAEDIPAATQIFTPKWIVKYMVENTVGKIYLDYEPESPLKSELKYLVENESDKQSTPIITDITELTLIDPACGSGHILVTGFELLFKMYREEGYTARQAVDSILKNNIYGLDIDDRAMQLARFAVLLKAAEFDDDVLNRGNIPNIYSFPENTLANSFKEEYYSKEQSNWFELEGMKLKNSVSMQWTEIEINTKTKKKKEVKKSMTVPKGSVLNDATIDALQAHCEEAILVDFSSDLENFWGADKMGYAYSEFFYAIELLQHGKNLGSAIKLKLSDESLEHVKKLYKIWLERESNLQLNAFDKVFWENLKPHLEVLLLLTKHYTSVVANPPYMVSGNMNPELKAYAEKHYPSTKGDLFTVFMEVAYDLTSQKCFYSMINQTSWMFKSSYLEFRKKIGAYYFIHSMLHLGARVFEELSGEVVQSTAFVVEKNKRKYSLAGWYYRLVEERTSKLKEEKFLRQKHSPYQFIVSDINLIPDSIFAYWISKLGLEIFNTEKSLSQIGDLKKGIATGDDKYFLRYWHEIKFNEINFASIPNTCSLYYKWLPINKGGGFRKWSGNFESIINWEKDGIQLRNFRNETGKLKSRPQNLSFSFLDGITYNIVSSKGFSGRLTHYPSMMCDVGPTIYNLKEKEYILGLLCSKVGQYFLDALCPGYKYDTGAVGKFPTKISDSNKVRTLVIQNTNISKKDWDSFETSWDFETSPLLNNPNSLIESYNHWSKQITDFFFQLHSNEEELNQIFIDVYGLQDELKPEVPLKDITILQDELNRNALEALEPTFREKGREAIELPILKNEIISQCISYAIGVFLGRYRLDKPGLNISHPNPTDEEAASYKYNGHKIEIDEDGILPIMGEDCAFPDDALVRTKDFVLAIWGEATLIENINFLHDCLGMDLHKWLTEKFWGYHTSMYKKKPIYWLFSSNVNKPQNAAFKVLVYMHRMDKYTVQKIQRNYLHPHQEYIKQEIARLKENEENLAKPEQKRLELLQNWEIECRDYNEVLKELANLQIEFDLDDGVEANYIKFNGAVAKI